MGIGDAAEARDIKDVDEAMVTMAEGYEVPELSDPQDR